MCKGVGDEAGDVVVGERVEDVPPFAPPEKQAVGEQDFEPLRKHRERDSEVARDIADALLSADEPFEDPQPAGLADGKEHPREPFELLVTQRGTSEFRHTCTII